MQVDLNITLERQRQVSFCIMISHSNFHTMTCEQKFKIPSLIPFSFHFCFQVFCLIEKLKKFQVSYLNINCILVQACSKSPWDRQRLLFFFLKNRRIKEKTLIYFGGIWNNLMLFFPLLNFKLKPFLFLFFFFLSFFIYNLIQNFNQAVNTTISSLVAKSEISLKIFIDLYIFV